MSFDKMSFKCVFVGDGAVGKTSLLVTFAQGTFPEEYVPTVFDNYQKQMFFKTAKFTLQLWDTAGQEEYGKLRTMSYPDTDCFVICFSLLDRDSYNNIFERWYKDLMEHNVASTPILLVGTKYDLRKDEKICNGIVESKGEDFRPVDVTEAEEMRKKIAAFQFVQCSSKTGFNLNKVFQSIVNYLCEKQISAARKPEKKKGGLTSLFSSVSKQPLQDELANIDYDIPDDDEDD